MKGRVLPARLAWNRKVDMGAGSCAGSGRQASHPMSTILIVVFMMFYSIECLTSVPGGVEGV